MVRIPDGFEQVEDGKNWAYLSDTNRAVWQYQDVELGYFELTFSFGSQATRYEVLVSQDMGAEKARQRVLLRCQLEMLAKVTKWLDAGWRLTEDIGPNCLYLRFEDRTGTRPGVYALPVSFRVTLVSND